MVCSMYSFFQYCVCVCVCVVGLLFFYILYWFVTRCCLVFWISFLSFFIRRRCALSLQNIYVILTFLPRRDSIKAYKNKLITICSPPTIQSDNHWYLIPELDSIFQPPKLFVTCGSNNLFYIYRGVNKGSTWYHHIYGIIMIYSLYCLHFIHSFGY